MSEPRIAGQVIEVFKHTFILRRPSGAHVLCCEDVLPGGDFALNKGEYDTALKRPIHGLIFMPKEAPPIAVKLPDFKRMLEDRPPKLQTGRHGRTDYFAIEPKQLALYQTPLHPEQTNGTGDDIAPEATELFNRMCNDNSKAFTMKRALEKLGYELTIQRIQS